MGRLLILLILAIAVVWLLRRSPLFAGARRPRISERTVDTIRCADCGVYLPERDAVKALGSHYCQKHAPRP